MRLPCTLAFVIAGIGAGTGPAFAGTCDDDNGEQALKTIEHYAKDPTSKPPEVWGLCMQQVIAVQPKRTERFLAACDKILETDRTFGVCVKWPIEIGKKQLGKIDLFDLVEGASPKPLIAPARRRDLHSPSDAPSFAGSPSTASARENANTRAGAAGLGPSLRPLTTVSPPPSVPSPRPAGDAPPGRAIYLRS